ncbi:YdcF family protein [Methyloversatilis thermotolerans]|uniref:YdcF family protein n=1 Tax=Methyloversatilis thermotolerans TaxID=1346290 RepID=UPI00035DE064|nr:YdcF family protein [Methyloversatilis thermotolerans]
MDSLSFLLKKLLSFMVLPPASLLLLIAAGLLLSRWRRRSGMVLASVGLALLYALSTPMLSGRLERSTYADDTLPGVPAGAAAIVVLGAGIQDNLVDYGGDTVNGWALERVRAGARLAKQSGLPVLVSGGVVWGGRPEGVLMAEAMQDFGIRVRWIESTSRDTADNARMSAAMLGEAGIHRVALVTHAMHMRRSLAEFRRAGLDPVPMPTLIRRPGDDTLTDLLPGTRALQQSAWALHEWLGWLALALRS